VVARFQRVIALASIVDGLASAGLVIVEETVAASRRQWAARRRADRQMQKRMAFNRGVVALGLMMLAASAVAVPLAMRVSGHEPQPIAEVPPDDPERGLVYEGLVPAKKGAPCVGGYEVGDANTCAHGPDPAPSGLDVKIPVEPVAAAVPEQRPPARDSRPAPSEKTVAWDIGAIAPADGSTTAPAVVPDAAPAAFTMGAAGVACDGDGQAGKRVQVLYAYESGTTNRYGQFVASIRVWAAGVEAIYNASAADTGGERHVRFVTTPECAVDVAEVQLPAGGLQTFNATINALRGLGFNKTDRKYMIFADADIYCGIGTFAGDDRPGANNRSNVGPSYGRSDNGCWTAAVAAHELGHNLGAVNDSAPNTSGEGHCLDERDLMCYRDSSGKATRIVCTDPQGEQRLDCGHDDYFNTRPSPGSYLAAHWNVANNEFLIPDSGGGGPGPTPTPTVRPTATPTPTGPAPTATPTATATATPTPTPTSTAPPATLQVTAVAPTSARVQWTAAAAGTRYAIRVNGRVLGVVQVTSVRLIALRPNTQYTAQIFTVNGGQMTAHTAPVTFRTLPVAPLKRGAWVTLTNSLTGGAADVYGARRADGAPVVLGRRTDGANQRWRLRAAAAGAFLLENSASTKCLAIAGGAARAGAPLVQQACNASNPTQHWRLVSTAYGFSLAPAAGDLVVGVSASRFNGRRPLVLQAANERRYQSWTAVA